MKNNNGFTIMEVMVVVAIIGILAAIVIPNMFAYLPKHRLNQGARAVYSAIQTARLRAVKDQTDVVVDFDLGADSLKVFIDDGRGAGGVAGDSVQNGDEPTVRSESMPRDVDISAAAFAGANTWAEFDSRGMPNGLSGTVTLESTSQPQHARRISVSAAGLPKTRISTDGGATWSD